MKAVTHKQEMQLFRSLKKNRSTKKPDEDLSHLNAFIHYIRKKMLVRNIVQW